MPTATQVQPYLFFEGRCEEALEFYRRTLGAEVLALMRSKDSPDPAMAIPGAADKVIHAMFRIGETTLLASDGRCQGPPSFQGFALSLTVSGETEAGRLFAALGRGRAGADAIDEDVLLAELRDARRSLRRLLDDLRGPLSAGHWTTRTSSVLFGANGSALARALNPFMASWTDGATPRGAAGRSQRRSSALRRQ